MLATVISFWAVISVEILHPDLSEIPPRGAVWAIVRWRSQGFTWFRML